MPTHYTIGVDIGGTKINAALIRGTKVVRRSKLPTETALGARRVMENIVRAVVGVMQPDVRGIGIGIGGLVDHEDGRFLAGPNFPKAFRNVELSRTMRRTFGIRAAVDNDVHCFTLAEAVLGSGKGLKTVVGITLGTGIGGGIAIDGNIHRGSHNAAGEFGHMIVADRDAPKCGCGRAGHLESLSSGSAIAKLYQRSTGRRTDALEIERLANGGNAKARAAFERATDALGKGVANIIHSLDPDIIVVGGGIARAGRIWAPLRAAVRGHLVFPILRSTPIVRSKLGDDANVLGASLLLERR